MKRKPKITDELIDHVSLLRERIFETNSKILILYKKQLEDVSDIHDIMSDYQIKKDLESWYLDVVNFMSKVGIEGSNDRFKPLE